jgi:eukaryotic-like serine/threonine-protein kinase
VTTEGTHDSRSRAFLRERVGRFGLLVGALFGAFLLFRTVTMLISAPKIEFLEGHYLWHLAATLCFVATWAACRLGPDSESYVRGVETVGLASGTLTTALMALGIPLLARPEMIMLLALGLGFSARSVYVPSTGRRTLMLGVLMVVPIVLTTYEAYLSIDPAVIALAGESATPAMVAGSRALESAVWWSLAVTVATSASIVIYGLRREVRDAKQVGQYRLEEKLGEGGMGAVYRAHHALLRRPTAVKLLPAHKAGEAIERFEREVQMTARLSHPNTVTIYDYGRTGDGVFYYAMELIEGATLAEVVEIGGPQPAGRVRALMRQAADALIEAHGIGLIHRDIKPANIMVFLPHHLEGLGEVVKVVDFGLVKDVTGIEGIGVTNTEVITGTPQYMAPEAMTDPAAVDGRTDLYALGAVAYYLVTGRHVFEGTTLIEVCSKHLHAVPDPPSVDGRPIDPGLSRLILDCLEKEPGARPQRAIDVRDRLDALEGLGVWGPVEAAAWWAECDEALRKGRTRTVLSTGETLEIGIGDRATVAIPEHVAPR